ncbi:unnamed protein product [Porites lobata]|uniref:Uncharacterized protein n=1 Tax=Porites lobata TaxID=104759 RepID=A0ABN8SI32_9CNID|nr:unnamed protein product [Porites lobata]
MRTALDKFNNLECSLACPFLRSLEFDQVKNPEADVWLRSEFVGSDSPVPITVRRRAIDLYHLLERAKEEVTLLEEKGKNIFLKMKLLSLEGQLLEVKRLFEGHIGEVPLPNFIFDQNSIPLQDDENEADEVSESLLSLPETEEDEVDSETDCESDCDDTDSAFFSSSGILL